MFDALNTAQIINEQVSDEPEETQEKKSNALDIILLAAGTLAGLYSYDMFFLQRGNIKPNSSLTKLQEQIMAITCGLASFTFVNYVGDQFHKTLKQKWLDSRLKKDK